MITAHNTEKNEMVQVFSDRVKIVVDLVTDRTFVFIDGELKASYDHLTTEEFINIQEKVEEVSRNLEKFEREQYKSGIKN